METQLTSYSSRRDRVEDLKEDIVPDNLEQDDPEETRLQNHGATPCCPICRNLSPEARGYKLRWDEDLDCLKERSLQLFEDSSRRGCVFCSLVSDIIQTFVDWEPSTPPTLDLELWSNDQITLRPTLSFQRYKFALFAVPNCLPLWEGLEPVPPFSYNADGAQYFDFIKSHLQACVETHGLCRQETSFLPKRLIDVGKDNQTIKLVEPDITNLKAPYAALSHCWGQVRHFITERSTIEIRKKGIKWHSLPRTFCDAITVARALSVRYLWIDSLCILQDCKEDWLVQSSQMGQIYQSAFITIAAASSASSEEGFLRTNSTISKVLSYDRGSARRHIVANINLTPHSREPLDTRGWAFQEYHLASRLIQFCTGDIIYRCKTSEECECGWTTFRQDGQDRLGNYNNEDMASEPKGAMTRWHQLVEAYSSRNLTINTDKLPALSGLAAFLNNKMGWQYVAGLWKETLTNGLLWELRDCSTLLYAPKVYLAPSFSWASVSQPVWFHKNNSYLKTLETESPVLECHCSTLDQDQFGQLSSGYIILKGRIMPVEVHTNNPEKGDYDVSSTAHGAPLLGVFEPDAILGTTDVIQPNGVACKSVRRLNPGEVAEPFTSKAYAFWMPAWEVRKARDPYALLLALSGKERGAYERIGFYRPPSTGYEEEWERAGFEYCSLRTHPEEAIVKII